VPLSQLECPLCGRGFGAGGCLTAGAVFRCSGCDIGLRITCTEPLRVDIDEPVILFTDRDNPG